MTEEEAALRSRLELTQGSEPGTTPDLLSKHTSYLLALEMDIRSSVVHWAYTGEYLDHPVIDGASPASLAQVGLIPTQVFSTLAGLRVNPDHTRAMMRQHSGKLPGDDLSRQRRMKPKSERRPSA